MKKINLVLSAIAFMGLGLASCSDDDDDNKSVNDGISGTYVLTEFNTQTATDLNGDGTSNFNQKLESTCYTNTRVVLNSNNTFTYYHNAITVDSAAGTMTCTSTTYNGTWVLDAGTATTGIIEATFNHNGVENTLIFNKSSDELVNYHLFMAYADMDANGNSITNNGEVTLVFDKQ